MQEQNRQVAAPLTEEQQRFQQQLINLQAFTKKLNDLPESDSVDQTADKKAHTMLISHIEMTLDEFFFGAWETENFQWTVIANEIVGSLDLIVHHPVLNKTIRRVGAAAVQIMVDAAPSELKGQERNRWYLNPDNKKSQALDMGFPKLKAECLKNAANSLGKLFGRDLNRKKSDSFNGQIKRKQTRWDNNKTENNE